MQDTSWSLGTLIGLPAFIASILVLVLAAAWLRRLNERVDSFDKGLPIIASWVSLGAAFVLCLIAAWGFYPYSAEYHQWRTVSGDVTDVNSRLVSAGKSSVNQRFVVEIDGHAYGCDDTRCASVKIGDRLTISCKREWQYAGVDGYGCNFVRNEARS